MRNSTLGWKRFLAVPGLMGSLLACSGDTPAPVASPSPTNAAAPSEVVGTVVVLNAQRICVEQRGGPPIVASTGPTPSNRHCYPFTSTSELSGKVELGSTARVRIRLTLQGEQEVESVTLTDEVPI